MDLDAYLENFTLSLSISYSSESFVSQEENLQYPTLVFIS